MNLKSFFQRNNKPVLRIYFDENRIGHGWFWELRFGNYQFAAKNIYGYASKSGCLKALKNVRKKIQTAKIVIEEYHE